MNCHKIRSQLIREFIGVIRLILGQRYVNGPAIGC
jgi:hypothetical protein